MNPTATGWWCWRVLLVLALLLAVSHCQEYDGDGAPSQPAGPDPAPLPTTPPPATKPPKEQAPDPAAAVQPSPPVQPTPTPTQPAAGGNGAAAAGPGPRPPVTPTTPPGGPAAGATPTGSGPVTPATPVTPVTPPPAAAGGTPPGVTTPPGVPPTTPGSSGSAAAPNASSAVPGAAAATTGGVPPATPTPPPGVTPGLPTITTPQAGGVTPPGVTPGVVVVPGAGGAVGVPGGVAVPGAGLPIGTPDQQQLQPPGLGVPGAPAANASAAGGNASAADNSTAIKGLAPNDQSAKLVSALLSALGATSNPPAERPNPIAAYEGGSDSSSTSTSGTTRRKKKRQQKKSKTRASARSTAGMSFQDIQSSSSYKEGMLTTADGSKICVTSKDMFAAEPAAGGQQQSLGGGSTQGFSFASAGGVWDPACADDAVAASYKARYCSGNLLGGGSGGGASEVVVAMPPAASSNSSSNSTSSSSGGSRNLLQSTQPIGGITVPTVSAPSPSPGPAVNASSLACTQAFTKVGSTPRSLAVVLIKWARNYYKTREECCREQGNPYLLNGCDCQWNGRTWDNLPPPSAYSRMFTDECDGKPSINRAYYDMSGGMVTFHGKTRVPAPASTATEDGGAQNGSAPGVTTIVTATTISKKATSTASDSPPQTPSPPSALLQAPINTLNGYMTNRSFIDPDGVDVYGWAVLDSMRNGDGECKDWCGDAIAQLGLNSSEYNHVMCMALYGNSKSICSACDATKGACVGTCPADGTVTMAQGCGCASCSFAWGQQAACNTAAGPGIRTGLSVPVSTYDEVEPPLLPVLPPRALLRMDRGNKLYMSHELGHNLGFNHAGALRCGTSNGIIMRQPAGCSPDTYGDATTFMGGGADLQVPNSFKYKMRWLPRATLRDHPVGTEQRYTIRPSTSRRPSWQDTTPVKWFSDSEVLAVRVPLTLPSPELASVGGYACPCGECGLQCTADTQCKAANASGTACCLDAKCADKGLSYLYIELHQPYRNDNNPTYKGIAIRAMGDVQSCTSTRAVAAYLDSDGRQRFLLDTPDPTGAAVGSRFEDPMRGVTVIFEEWTRAQAVVRVIA